MQHMYISFSSPSLPSLENPARGSGCVACVWIRCVRHNRLACLRSVMANFVMTVPASSQTACWIHLHRVRLRCRRPIHQSRCRLRRRRRPPLFPFQISCLLQSCRGAVVVRRGKFVCCRRVTGVPSRCSSLKERLCLDWICPGQRATGYQEGRNRARAAGMLC